MSKVYIIIGASFYEHEGQEIIEVYSSKEEATKKADYLNSLVRSYENKMVKELRSENYEEDERRFVESLTEEEREASVWQVYEVYEKELK